MQPSTFPEANGTLTKPAGMTDDECGSLPIFTDGKMCLSRWRPSWRERLAVAFGAPIWLWVWSGRTQPPVALQTERPFARVPSPRERWLAFIGAAAILLALCLPVAAQAPSQTPNPNDGPFSVSVLAGAVTSLAGADDTANVKGTGWIEAEMPLGFARPYARLGITARPEETFDLSNVATFSSAEAGFGIERGLRLTTDGHGRVGLFAEGGFSSVVSGDPSERLARYVIGGVRFSHDSGGQIAIGWGLDEQVGDAFGWGALVGYGSLPIGWSQDVIVLTGDFSLALQKNSGAQPARDVLKLGVMLDLGRAVEAIKAGGPQP